MLPIGCLPFAAHQVRTYAFPIGCAGGVQKLFGVGKIVFCVRFRCQLTIKIGDFDGMGTRRARLAALLHTHRQTLRNIDRFLPGIFLHINIEQQAQRLLLLRRRAGAPGGKIRQNPFGMIEQA